MARQIFISYSKLDAAFALKLAEDLENAGLDIWIDREIGGGQQWRRTIEENIQASTEMIVIVSKNSAASRWVQHESSIAYGIDKKLVPILIEEIGESSPFVWMDEIQYIDFVNDAYDIGFKELLSVLSPPNPIQDLLDQQLVAYRQTGDLIGEAMLTVIEDARSKLIITPEEEELIKKSAEAISIRQRLMRGGVSLVVLLVVIAVFAIAAVFEASTQRTMLVNTQDSAETQIAQLGTQEAFAALQATYAAQEANAAAAEATAQADQFVQDLNLLSAEVTAVANAKATAEYLGNEAKYLLELTQDELQSLLDEAGLVLVEEGPMSMFSDGSYLWVANREADTIQQVDLEARSVIATVDVGDQPVSIIRVEDAVWVANYGGDTISKIDVFTLEVEEFSVGSGPRDFAFDGEFLWLACENANSLQKIIPATGEVVFNLSVESGPVALEMANGDLWVANFENNTIQKIDVLSANILLTYNVRKGPTDLLFDGTYLWIANRVDDVVQQFNPLSGGVIRIINVSDAPTALAFDGASLWVANRGNDSVEMIDIQNGEVIANYLVGDFPRALAWDGSDLWVGNYYDGSIQSLVRETGAIVASVDVGDLPNQMVLAGSQLWVVSQGEKSVEQIDLVTRDVVSNIQVGGWPTSLVFTDMDLWATDYLGGKLIRVVNVVGRTVSQVEPGDVAEFDDEINEIDVGRGPRDAVWDGSGIWVANYLDDSIVRIDMQTNEITNIIDEIGDGPNRIIATENGLWVSLWNDRKIIHLNLVDGEIDVQIQLENRPLEIEWDGVTLWVLQNSVDKIYRFDGASGEPVGELLQTGEQPQDILLVEGLVWIANTKSGTLGLYDSETGALLHTIPVEDEPVSMVYEDGNIWVAAQSSNEVKVISIQVLDLLDQSNSITE